MLPVGKVFIHLWKFSFNAVKNVVTNKALASKTIYYKIVYCLKANFFLAELIIDHLKLHNQKERNLA